MSQLTATGASSVTVLSTGNALPTPAALDLPVPGALTDDLTAATAEINAYLEPSEGMLVTFPDTLSVSEYFELARYRAGDPQRGRAAAHLHRPPRADRGRVHRQRDRPRPAERHPR